ncbi:MAG: hypothetical protein JNM80_07250 [Phycisphaerae bacterium]|nr:hypothetical protein [Phycisphaerae bacterium]
MQSQTGSACNVCHHPSSTSNAGNCYKVALAARINAGQTIAQALASVEGLDSDNDGFSNLDEILRVRTDPPAGIGYNPGLIGAAGTDPCGSNPSSAVTNQRETPVAACYANCDGSTTTPVLNVNDFTCFLNQFAAGDTRANCDGSTTAPMLNVNDFTCFLNQFAIGCS